MAKLYESRPKMTYRKREKPEEELHTKKLCRLCGMVLTRTPWNSSVDLCFCSNTKCKALRQPAGTVPLVGAAITEYGAKEKKYHRGGGKR